MGHTTHRIEGTLVIKRALFLGGCFFDIPRPGPLSPSFWAELEKYTRRTKVRFCRIAPDQIPGDLSLPDIWRITENTRPRLPSATRDINLISSSGEILARCSSVCRRHIRIARGAGISVEEEDDLTRYALLSRQTARRQKFTAHSDRYFRSLLASFGESARMLVAKHGDLWLAAGVFTFFEDTGTYLYGASLDSHRELNAPTLLIWEAMELARRRGCARFDLLGITTDESPSHAFAGVTKFKKKFGGSVVHYHPETFLVFSPFWFSLFSSGKRAHSLLFRRSIPGLTE